MAETLHETELGYGRDIRLSDLIDVYTYVADGQYFLTRDGRMAVMFALPGMAGDPLSEDMKTSIADGLAMAFDQFPEGSSGQYIRFNHRDVSSDVEHFLSNVRDTGFAPVVGKAIAGVQERAATFSFFAHPLESQKAYEHVLHLREHGDDGSAIPMPSLVSTNGVGRGLFAMKSEQYLFFVMPTTMSRNGLADRLKRNVRDIFGLRTHEQILEELRRDEYAFLEHVERISNALHNAAMPPYVCGQSDMAALLYRMLNPRRSLIDGAPSVPIADTLADALEIAGMAPTIGASVTGTGVTMREGGWDIDGYHHMATSVKQMPEQTYPARLQEALDSTEGEGWLTVNFSVPGQGFFRNNLRMKTAMLENQKGLAQIPILAPDATKMAKQEQDLAFVKNATNPEEQTYHKVVRASVHFIVRDTDPILTLKRAKELEQKLWNSGYREVMRGDAVIHYSLPLNNRETARELIRRDQPVLSTNLADLLPVYTGFGGIDDGRMIMNSSTGEPVRFDVFTRHTTASHALIVGGTGTGKSFLANGLISQFRATRKSKVWVIDKGESFLAHCETVGGESVVLVPEQQGDHKPICLNPLWIDESDGHRNPTSSEYGFMLSNIVAMLKAGTTDELGKSETVTKEEQNCILNHLQAIFHERARGQEVTLSDWAAHMKRDADDTLAHLLVRRVADYLEGGIYAELFDGPLGVDWSNDFICIETQRMDKSPALEVVMLALFAQINTVVKNRKSRDLPAMLVIDEAWSALANSYCSKTVSSAFREWRKYLSQITLLSQAMTDFERLVNAEGSSDDGIFANTRHLFLLGSAKADIDTARRLFGLSAEEEAMWTSTVSSLPQYAEFFYLLRHKSNVNVSAKLRYCADPVTYWMSSSDAQDDAERNRRTQAIIEKGESSRRKARARAIQQLQKEMPYGVSFPY